MPGLLSPWAPIGELDELRSRLDQAYAHWFNGEDRPSPVAIDVERGKNYVRRERRYGSFVRSMQLPAGVDASKIKAKTKDGVVEITVPLPSEKKNEPVTITPTAG